MSESFDKEAEREKLREKYGEEREDRKATERMSELLLKGATMTDRHCDACGDPIFRYDGQAFCPTCETVVGGDQDEAVADTESEAAGGRSEAPARSAETAERGPSAGTEGRGSPADGQPSAPDDMPPAERSKGPDAEATGQQEPNARPEANVGTASEASAVPTGPADGRLDREQDDPRRALADAITQLARDAGTTDDPRRARELLAAAREAAEGLAALDGQ